MRAFRSVLVLACFASACRSRPSPAAGVVRAEPLVDAAAPVPSAAPQVADASTPATPRTSLDVAPSADHVGLTATSLVVRDAGAVTAYDPATLAVMRFLRLPASASVVSDRGEALLVSASGGDFRCRVDPGVCEPLPSVPGGASDQGMAVSGTGRTVVAGALGDAVPAGGIELRLHVLDHGARAFRTVKGPSYRFAGGTFQVCAVDDAAATWCPSRPGAVIAQDLATGKTTFDPRPAHWHAERSRGAGLVQGQNGIDVLGPGPSRLVEERPEGTEPPPVVTCGEADHAVVANAARRVLELRTLPAWKLAATVPAASVVSFACAPDASRVAWLAKEGASVRLHVWTR